MSRMYSNSSRGEEKRLFGKKNILVDESIRKCLSHRGERAVKVSLAGGMSCHPVTCSVMTPCDTFQSLTCSL